MFSQIDFCNHPGLEENATAGSITGSDTDPDLTVLALVCFQHWFKDWLFQALHKQAPVHVTDFIKSSIG